MIYNSKPERLMAEALNKAGISYSYQVPLYNDFILDFVINGTNLAIEVDGTYWHQNRKRKDQVRDIINSKRYVYRNSYKTIRFSDTEIYENMDACIQTIMNNM